MEQHNREAGRYEAEQEETEGQERKQTDKKQKILKEILNNGVMIIIALGIGLFLNKYVVANAQVPTGSMETTVMAGDRILVNRLSYVFGEPERGDIVTFIYPDDGETLYLKRIMGLPGETISGKDGVIYIDGEPLEKDFTQEISYEDFGPYVVPEGTYFMMGDNRNDSWDSRYWEHKFVEMEDIIGKAEVSYFPHPRLLK
ncbi:MAG: signal peptidase I [Lachnospiraceae bacterium]|nr:signal peptidase I [Lachnospiraceae bacterium]